MAGQHDRELVLVADDEEAVRYFVSFALRVGGFEVVEASDGLEALSWAAAYSGAIDLLLTDCAMPRMDGVRLSEQLAALHPETRILFMTGQWNGLAPRGPVLLKPFAAGDLLDRVRSVLGIR